MPTISLYARLRTLAGVKEMAVDGATLLAALQALSRCCPALEGAVLAGDALRPHVVVTVNGQHIDPDGGLAVPVQAGDQIAIFPPIAGG